MEEWDEHLGRQNFTKRPVSLRDTFPPPASRNLGVVRCGGERLGITGMVPARHAVHAVSTRHEQGAVNSIISCQYIGPNPVKQCTAVR